jgi:hypothetical protein
VSEVRFRDFDVLGPGEEVDLVNYIERIVPARVAVDAVYLRDPSMRQTLRALWDTVKHILGFTIPPLQVASDGTVEEAPGATAAPAPDTAARTPAEEPGSAA